MKVDFLSEPKCKVSTFAEENDLTLNIRRGPSGWFVSFEECDVKIGPFLRGECGDGATPESALADYCLRIAGELLIFGAFTGRRRSIRCPRKLVADEAALVALREAAHG